VILTDKQFKKYSKIVCDTVDINDGEEIVVKLLKESKNGIGLAAPQIGITKNVCVINVKEPLFLINPKIIDKSEETFVFPEGCLSYPNKRIKTKRHVQITVDADNHESELMFSADSKDINDAFECVAIQHEIDHLNGITMFDREFKLIPIKVDKKYGRNEKVKITNGKETKILKWKKAEPLIAAGKWECYIN
jgi:peptide deformylase